MTREEKRDLITNKIIMILDNTPPPIQKEAYAGIIETWMHLVHSDFDFSTPEMMLDRDYARLVQFLDAILKTTLITAYPLDN